MTDVPYVSVDLVPGPLGPMPGRDGSAGRSGAVIGFEGVVRRQESGRDLRALRYEAYEPMTTRELSRLARRVMDDHGLERMAIRHSVGDVAVGEVSFQLRVESAHRKAALAAMDDFIDAMKRDVPLWKTPVWSEPR